MVLDNLVRSEYEMNYKVIAFDLYGTLLNTDGTKDACVRYFGDKGIELVSLWRRFQLEFTWLRSLTGDFKDFDEITADALVYSIELLGLDHTNELVEDIARSYLDLPAFDEVGTVLARLNRNFETMVVSNGTPSSIKIAVKNAELHSSLNYLVSASAGGVFKPSPIAYDQIFGFTACSKAEILFVSSNSWDINGASTYGFDTFWVNRRRAPFENLGARSKYVGQDLNDLMILLDA